MLTIREFKLLIKRFKYLQSNTTFRRALIQESPAQLSCQKQPAFSYVMKLWVCDGGKEREAKHKFH